MDMHGIPQITYIVLFAFSGYMVARDDGKPQPPQSFKHWIVSASINLALLTAGGFFHG